MKKMPASAFKAKCLAVMDQVCASGEAVVVTKRGRAVVKVVPVKSSRPPVFGRLRGIVEVTGEIERPIIRYEDWELD
jgi:prevent-host-death family protein